MARITVRNSHFERVGTVYKLVGDVQLDDSDNTYKDVGTVYDAETTPAKPPAIPEDVMRAVLEILSNIERETGRKPTLEDAERAAERSGLRKWMVDQSVNIASLGVSLLTFYLQHGPK